MHIYILGICGTFMGSLALLAREQGYRVSGADQHVYPPMSTQLADSGIVLHEGYDPEHIVQLKPDVIVIGNAMSRGNVAVEYVLNQNLPYVSGPQWLAENVLQGRWVLAVAGTHGKTTTSSMLAWILEYAGMSPGYLIGGVPENFPTSASLGASDFFVIEADEYDSAFFDKRSKFVHYHPRTLVLNNLEYDHADIFDDLEAIETQFHHLLRTVPSQGSIFLPSDSDALQRVVMRGCWSSCEYLNGPDSPWIVNEKSSDQTAFEVHCRIHSLNSDAGGELCWELTGQHNLQNAIAAVAAARHVGVSPALAVEALSTFRGVKRRMQLLGTINNIRIFDDFAHHPTAIMTTLAGVRAQVGDARIIAVIEPRSNTMRMGVHAEQLGNSVVTADKVIWLQASGNDWSLRDSLTAMPKHQIHENYDDLVVAVVTEAMPGDTIVVMSNGGFGGVHQRIMNGLQEKYTGVERVLG